MARAFAMTATAKISEVRMMSDDLPSVRVVVLLALVLIALVVVGTSVPGTQDTDAPACPDTRTVDEPTMEPPTNSTSTVEEPTMEPPVSANETDNSGGDCGDEPR